MKLLRVENISRGNYELKLIRLRTDKLDLRNDEMSCYIIAMGFYWARTLYTRPI